MSTQATEAISLAQSRSKTVFPVLWAVSLCHLLNDMTQALLPAVYPILRGVLDLSFAQVGFLTFVYQLTASLLQPFIGLYTDRRPMPYSLPFGMASSMAGLLTIAFAPSYAMLLVGSMLLGLGSSIFHPESSRIARLASGGSHGLAQSLFQVGGNFGSALGPLAAAFIVLPRGQSGLAWFALATLAGIIILTGLGHWYQHNGHAKPRSIEAPARHPTLSRGHVSKAMSILIALMFSKFIYLASFTSYYTFFLIDRFGLSTKDAQIYQFVFFAAVAAGTVAGGPIGDRLGRKPVIWVSILGVLPFTLLLAPCRSHGDRCAQRRDWLPDRFGFPRDGRLRAGTDAGPRRHGVGSLLWLRVRDWGYGSGGARRARGLARHPIRVPAVLVPPRDWCSRGLSAEPARRTRRPEALSGRARSSPHGVRRRLSHVRGGFVERAPRADAQPPGRIETGQSDLGLTGR